MSLETWRVGVHDYEHCQNIAILDDMIRDCLACGINVDVIQKHLLAEPNLIYKRGSQYSRQEHSVAEK